MAAQRAVLVFVLITQSICALDPIIHTFCGDVRGNELPGGANEYLGMPFGVTQRFAKSELRSDPFDQSPLDATYFGPACLQTLTATSTYGKEDCLVMNVWAPRSLDPSSDHVPVLVYVYGGSNDFGEAEPYNASQLAVNQNIVVASFNYRTGPLGFLAFEDEIQAGRSSGNYALQDIQTALTWLKREIQSFGGDSSRMAIFGQSSGAGLVQLQLAIPSSAGMFSGAISQSGSFSAQRLEESYNTTKEMHQRLNCTERGFQNDTLTCLRNTDADAIIIAQGTQCVTPNVCYGLSFGPVVDSILIPEQPRVMLQDCSINTVNVLYGVNTNDSNLFVHSSYWKPVDQTEYISALNDSLGTAASPSLLARALTLYPPLPDPNANHVGLIGWFTSDRAMCENRRLVHAIAKCFVGKRQKAFVYRYNYWFQSNKTCTAVSNYHKPELGSMHQDEVSFVFGQPIFMNIGYSNCSSPGWPGYDPTCLGCVFNEKEQTFANTIGTFWSNFAASGDPNIRGSSAISPFSNVRRRQQQLNVWPSYTNGTDGNILLEPLKAPYTPETMRSEVALGRKEFCDLWDFVDGQKPKM
eukprot:c6226_g1_i1.p1 GENE.c6226_g1_i1~~c6226_g1_i1.p1  ORF type:complete len:595 (+),score=127.26 c6226_g1_i1:44-1786(+)